VAKTQVVSFSELDSLRQCPHKHQLQYIERWQEPRVGPALITGTAWHSIMEIHYRAIQLVNQGRLEMEFLPGKIGPEVEELLAGEEPERAELLRWMYEGHLQRWGYDTQWEVVAVEHAAEVYLPTDRGGRSRFKLKLKLDLAVMWDRKLWIVDHKSGKNLPTDKELDIDDQFGLYTWAMRQLGKPVFGSIHSANRTQRNKKPMELTERLGRRMLYRTDAELDTIAVEAYRTFKTAYPASGVAPRSPNSDTCRWRCSFTEPCLQARKTKGTKTSDLLPSFGFAQDFTRH